MRIAIVNDMMMAVEVLRRIVSSSTHTIAWVAMSGTEAVEKCRNDRPDLILMDMVMPEMNGVETTRKIMKETPCAILIVTSSVTENAAMVFEAMGAGALDAVSTPVAMGALAEKGREEFLGKIRMIERLVGANRRAAKANHIQPASTGQCLLAIGSSTGGPHAVAAVLGRLPRDFDAPVVIVQHVDAAFAQGFTEWLDKQTELEVRVAKDGDTPQPGKVYVAATNNHLVYGSDKRLKYTEHPVEMVYRPSVDVFYKSVVENWGGPVVGVLLTGMGRDGAEGLLALRKKGAHTIAQNETTCTVYGMPKAAAEINAAVEILGVDDIASAILRHINNKNDINRTGML